MVVGKEINNLHPIVRLLIAQTLLPILLSVILLLIGLPKAAYSVLLGGAVCVIANLIVAYGVFPLYGRRTSVRITKRFYVAEASKYATSLLLMLALFQWVALNALAFFVSYIATQLVFWAAPLLTKSTRGVAAYES